MIDSKPGGSADAGIEQVRALDKLFGHGDAPVAAKTDGVRRGFAEAELRDFRGQEKRIGEIDGNLHRAFRCGDEITDGKKVCGAGDCDSERMNVNPDNVIENGAQARHFSTRAVVGKHVRN